MKSDISQEHEDILNTDKDKLAEPLDIKQLLADGVISGEGDWYRVNDFQSLPQSASNRVARLEQDENGIKVQFLGQEEFESILQEMNIPDSD